MKNHENVPAINGSVGGFSVGGRPGPIAAASWTDKRWPSTRMDWTVFSKKRGTLTRKLTTKMATMVERVQRRSISGFTWNGCDTAR